MTAFFRKLWTRATTWQKWAGTFGISVCVFNIVNYVRDTEYTNAFIQFAVVYLFIDGLYWYQETTELRAAASKPSALSNNTNITYNIDGNRAAAWEALDVQYKREQNRRNYRR